MMLSTYDEPVIYFCLKSELGTKYMIGYAWRNLTLVHIVCAAEVFMTMYFLHNGCTFNIVGNVRTGVLTILTVVTLKWLKESTNDNNMVFIYL